MLIKTNVRRNVSLDLLRVLVMLFIVVHHCIVSGLGLNEAMHSSNFLLNGKNLILMFMNSFVVVAVNIFFLLSGYFSIHFRVRKVIYLFIEILFYSCIIYLISVIAGIGVFSVKEFVKYSILSVTRYWFMIVYFALMLIAPALNILTDKLKDDHKAFLFLIGSLTFILCVYGFFEPLMSTAYIGANSGYSLLNAVFLYTIGRYIFYKREYFKYKSKCYFGLYGLSSILTWGGGIFLCLLNKSIWAWQLYSYNSLLIAFASISLFLAFMRIEKLPTFFGKLSLCSNYILSVYLIHSMPLLVPYRFLFLKNFLLEKSIWLYPLSIVIYCLVLFFICIAIDFVRDKLFIGVVAIFSKIKLHRKNDVSKY